jgi:hypothetical protein
LHFKNTINLIRNVTQLFTRGVCQVRNNIVHGEKYIEVATPRDDALVKEAMWVLQKAIRCHPVMHRSANVGEGNSEV